MYVHLLIKTTSSSSVIFLFLIPLPWLFRLIWNPSSPPAGITIFARMVCLSILLQILPDRNYTRCDVKLFQKEEYTVWKSWYQLLSWLGWIPFHEVKSPLSHVLTGVRYILHYFTFLFVPQKRKKNILHARYLIYQCSLKELEIRGIEFLGKNQVKTRELWMDIS